MSMSDIAVVPSDTISWTQAPALTSVLTYQQPATLLQSEINMLQALSGVDDLDLAMGLMGGNYQAYRLGTTLTLVKAVDNTLHIMAIIQHGKPGNYFRSLVRDLRRLAQSWNCRQVETSTEDIRIAKLLQVLGAVVIETTLALEV